MLSITSPTSINLFGMDGLFGGIVWSRRHLSWFGTRPGVVGDDGARTSNWNRHASNKIYSVWTKAIN